MHADGRACPRQTTLLERLHGLRCDVLILAGDIFQRWADDGHMPHPELAPVVEAIARVAPKLVFTPGNHDWAAGPFLRRHLGAEVAPVARLTLDGRRYHVSHGDDADESPGYRALRAVLRSTPVALARRALGAACSWRIEGALGHAPAGTPDPRLIAAQRTRAQALLAGGGADVVVNGHTHAPGVEHHPGGTWVNLGDGHHTWGIIEDGIVTVKGPPPTPRPQEIWRRR